MLVIEIGSRGNGEEIAVLTIDGMTIEIRLVDITASFSSRSAGSRRAKARIGIDAPNNVRITREVKNRGDTNAG